VAPSVGSVGLVGDAHDNAPAESTIGLFENELIKPRAPWRTVEQVEIATFERVEWINHAGCTAPEATSHPPNSKAPTTVTTGPTRSR